MTTANASTQAKPLGKYPYVKRAGDNIYVSGMSARLADGSVGGTAFAADGSVQSDVRIQTRLVIEKIRDALATHGATLEDCAAMTVYLVDMKDFDAYNQVYGEYFSEQGPTRTTVAVHQLPHPHMVVELTAVAFKPL